MRGVSVKSMRELERRAMSTVEVAIEASHLRLRPILMTSFAFIMGVVPLVLSHGTDAEMRDAARPENCDSVGNPAPARHLDMV